MKHLNTQRKFVNNCLYVMAAIATLAVCGCANNEAGLDESSKPAFIVPEETEEPISSINMETVTVEIEDIETLPPLDIMPTKEPQETIQIVMVGDILMHTSLNKLGVAEDGTKDFNFMFDNTRDIISAADIAMVNMEVVLGGEELKISGYPTFNTYTEVGDALVEAGFDVVLAATNHALDRKGEGVKSTLKFWRDNHPEMKVAGIYDSREDYESLLIYEIKGIKIAILNYTYSTNGIPVPDDMPYAVRMLDTERIKKDMALAREEADFIIVCPHWGTEYKLEADDRQKKWAQLFADEGADLIIGTHPHVIEPYEEIISSDLRIVPVYYSLGNYINCTSETELPIAKRMIGAMADVTLLIDEGSVSVKECTQRELITYVSPDKSEINTFFAENFTKEMCENSYTYTIDRGFTYEYCNTLWSEIFGG